MLRVSILALMLCIAALGQRAGQPGNASVAVSGQRSNQPTPQLLSAAMTSSKEDHAAESRLLELANQSRADAGAPPLRLDPSLSDAAREHARLMVEARRLTHQFNGEPALMERI